MSTLNNTLVNRILCVAATAAVLVPINACRDDAPVAPTAPWRQVQKPQRTSNQSDAQPVYPLKVSANRRYLVDQNDVPFLGVGDTPHLLFMNVSVADAATYFQARHAQGFNMISAQFISYNGMNVPTFDGIKPFLTSGDPTTPNPAYFARIDSMVNLAGQYGITVYANPMSWGGLKESIRAAGTTKMNIYGQYLGNRYKNFPNIVWKYGEDFYTWASGDDQYMLALANGVRSTDPNHIHTVELGSGDSSLDDPNWAPIVGIDGIYEYCLPSYVKTYRDYNRSNFLPVELLDTEYEQDVVNCVVATPYVVRNETWWTLTGGGRQVQYGDGGVYPFASGWQNHLSDPGAVQHGYATSFFRNLQWWNMVPDQNHTVMTAGFGTFNTGRLGTNDYATTERTSDGSMVVSYIPTSRTVTIDMTRLAGAATAQWYDPTTNTYQTITGSPFANTGSRQFTTPSAAHSDGKSDWVLLLQASSAPDTQAPTSPVILTSGAVSSTQTNFTWSASTDDFGVAGYRIYRDGTLVTTTTGTSYSDAGLTPSTTYSYAVSAYDAANNESAQSAPVSITTLTPDTQAPSVPANVAGTGVSTSQINLTWTASTDNVGVVKYTVYRNGGLVGSVTSTSFNDTGLAAGTTYSYSVAAQDAAGNVSAQSSPVSVATQAPPPPDTQAPSVPTNLAGTAVSSSQINLTWTASTDNVGVAKYTVYRNGSVAGTVTTTNFNDAGLTAATAYSYSVAAQDAAGNMSAQSASVSVTTQPPPIVTLPSGLMAYWSFNESAGATAADGSGNNNTATLVNNPARVAGKTGNALSFNGTNNRLSVPNSTSLNVSGNGLTIAMWVNPQSTGRDATLIGKFWGTSMSSPYYQYGIELVGGNQPYLDIGKSTGLSYVSMGSTLPYNQWSYLAITFNGTQVNFYVNGTLVRTRSMSASITARTSTMNIGSDVSPSQFYKGAIDEVRIYNRALSASEITTIMNAQ
jgi:chitodextrinase